MTPDEALDMYRRQIAEHGETVTVRRWSGPAAARVATDVATLARVAGYQPREIVGPVIAGDCRVIALVDTLGALLPLTTADKLVIRGREVAIKGIDDNTRRIAGTLIAIEIQAAG